MIITGIFSYIYHSYFYLSLLILRAGDVELNPGPYQPKFPCKYCNYAAKWNQKCLQCNLCNVSSTIFTPLSQICFVITLCRLQPSILVARPTKFLNKAASQIPLRDVCCSQIQIQTLNLKASPIEIKQVRKPPQQPKF